MLFGHVAMALELIGMAISGILIIACCKACCRFHSGVCHKEVDRTDGREVAVDERHKNKKHCFGFLKFVGYFTLIVSFLGFICTAITTATFWSNVKEVIESPKILNTHPNMPTDADVYPAHPVDPKNH